MPLTRSKGINILTGKRKRLSLILDASGAFQRFREEKEGSQQGILDEISGGSVGRGKKHSIKKRVIEIV